MSDDVDKLTKKKNKNDVIYSFRLFKTVVFPFAVCFLELTLAISKHLDTKQRKLRDYKGEVIADFSLEGIAYAFNWSNKGFVYSEEQSKSKFNKLHKSTNLVKDLFKPEYQELDHLRVMVADRVWF